MATEKYIYIYIYNTVSNRWKRGVKLVVCTQIQLINQRSNQTRVHPNESASLLRDALYTTSSTTAQMRRNYFLIS